MKRTLVIVGIAFALLVLWVFETVQSTAQAAQQVIQHPFKTMADYLSELWRDLRGAFGFSN